MFLSREYFIMIVTLIHIRIITAEANLSFKIVNTRHGPVKGVEKSSPLCRNYFNFQGIPYMKSPIGKLRFRDPQPPDNWTEPLDVTQHPPSYNNKNFLKGVFEGKEDAGVINVYTPMIDPQEPMPVMAFIHSGGFVSGSGGPDEYGPEYFMRKNIVLVTFNYRLGVIGFLRLENPELEIPGNAGLKDQVFALKWIQENIENFGGDPGSVTLFGQSAGGASVHLHLMSEQSRGLFHRAIVMSGVAFNSWTFAPPSNWNERLLNNLGHKFTNEQEMLRILENTEPEKLINASNVQTERENYGTHVMFPFGPKIEPYVTENFFLTENPVKAARKAWGNEIDCIFGFTSFESLFGHDQKSPEFANTINYPKNNFGFFAPLNELGLDENSEEAKTFGKMIKENYFGKLDPSLSNVEPYFYFRSDLDSTHGLVRAVKSRLKHGSGKTFVYRFDADTGLNYVKRNLSKKENYPGAAHCDDVFYLFTSDYVPPPEDSSIESKMIHYMVDLWTSFAITGTPKVNENENWTPVASSSQGALNCFNVGTDEQKMIPMPEHERLKIWDEIYEKAGVDLI